MAFWPECLESCSEYSSSTRVFSSCWSGVIVSSLWTLTPKNRPCLLLHPACLLHAACITHAGSLDFMVRSRVMARANERSRPPQKPQRARSIEDKDVAAEARRQFKASRDETDPLKIQMLVADATNHLEAMQGSARGAESSGGEGSWLDIDDPEDKRGRVGEGFPWQQ